MNILLVDDVKDNVDVSRVYLRDYPVQLQTAQNGREALNVMEAGRFDIYSYGYPDAAHERNRGNSINLRKALIPVYFPFTGVSL